MGTHNINTVCCEDDVVLVADCENNFRILIYRFTKLGKKQNLVVCIYQTKWVSVLPYPIRCKAVIDIKLVEQLKEIKYLVTTIFLLQYVERLERKLQEVMKAVSLTECLNYTI